MLIWNKNIFFRKETAMHGHWIVTLFELIDLNQKEKHSTGFRRIRSLSTSVYVNIDYVKFTQMSPFEFHRPRRCVWPRHNNNGCESVLSTCMNVFVCRYVCHSINLLLSLSLVIIINFVFGFIHFCCCCSSITLVTSDGSIGVISVSEWLYYCYYCSDI